MRFVRWSCYKQRAPLRRKRISDRRATNSCPAEAEEIIGSPSYKQRAPLRLKRLSDHPATNSCPAGAKEICPMVTLQTARSAGAKEICPMVTLQTDHSGVAEEIIRWPRYK